MLINDTELGKRANFDMISWAACAAQPKTFIWGYETNKGQSSCAAIQPPDIEICAWNLCVYFKFALEIFIQRSARAP